MDAKRLSEIEARAKAATEGPYSIQHKQSGEIVVGHAHTAVPGAYVVLFEVDWATAEDCVFIAHARQDIPDLIAYVRRLEAALQCRAITLREAWPHDLSYD